MIVVSVAVNVFLCILMAVTIYYCWKLNKYLNIIRDSRSELARVINDFSVATNRAQTTTSEIRQTAEAIADKLQIKIEKAEFMADDLAYIINKAGKLSDELGKQVGDIMAAKPKQPTRAAVIDPAPAAAPISARSEPTRPADPAQAADKKPRSKAEIELLQALKSIK